MKQAAGRSTTIKRLRKGQQLVGRAGQRKMAGITMKKLARTGSGPRKKRPQSLRKEEAPIPEETGPNPEARMGMGQRRCRLLAGGEERARAWRRDKQKRQEEAQQP